MRPGGCGSLAQDILIRALLRQLHSVHSKPYGLHRAQLRSHDRRPNRFSGAALALSVMLACCQEVSSETPAVTTSFLQQALFIHRDVCQVMC